jgi:hypothetical protein
LYEAWERFKDLLRRYPQHGYDEWMLIDRFYNGLNGQSRTIVDSTAGGSLMAKSIPEAYNLLEEMSTNSYQWPSERSIPKKTAGIYDVDPLVSLSAQVSALSNQIAALNNREAASSREAVAGVSTSCAQDEYTQEQVQFVNNRNFNYRPNHLPTHYHPGLRNHENFSYANNRNVLQPPPGFNQQAVEKKPSVEDLLSTFIVETRGRFNKDEARLDNIETHCNNMNATMKSLEVQIGQLANAVKGQSSGNFPSDTEPNPKDHCKAITLRSGKEVEAPKPQEDKTKEEEVESEQLKESARPKSISFSDNPPLITPTLPYPQRFKKKKLDTQFSKFLEIFKKIHINIPFADALEQMPNYVKFMKDVMAKKRRLEDYETVKLTEECSAILQRKLPQKLKDPGSFTIPCTIGDSYFEKALCDLGASINLMPLSVFRKLGLGEVTPTTICLQMADRSLTYPRGVIEDVLVKVDKFFFPADFVVLDMEEDREIPIILGRPFLATGRALIDVQSGQLTLRVNNEEVRFNILNTMRFPEEKSTCHRVEVIDSCIKEFFKEVTHGDPLEHSLTTPLNMTDFSGDFCIKKEGIVASVLALEALPCEVGDVAQAKILEKPDECFTSPSSSKEGLVLKQLPEHLRYAFLGEDSSKPVIISASLNKEEEEKLLVVLKRHEFAFAWSISDIKGISPTICMHKILMEDAYKPSIEHQRRLNPAMKEVVRAEVLKLLNVGIIYAISNSSWVSPVQVVPKKGGMTVVKNENNELIPSRTVTGWRVCIDYRKLNKATRKDHFPLPFIDQMLDRLAGYDYYCFLDGYSGYNQIAIAPEDQEKTTFTCPYGTFAFRRMPFGLCNAPATFQRCMMAIFSDMVEEILEIFMDDFSVFGSTFDHCLHNLSLVLQRFEEKNLVLNWEKCHFMVQEGIVLGHRISSQGIEVDKAKIATIEKLPPPINVKGVRSFLGHAGFYRRFIKDFSKVIKPLCNLLEKDAIFNFDGSCLEAFNIIKEKLVSAPVIVAPDWNEPFEIMCDASDYAVGAVLGQRRDKIFRAIYYASKTLNEAQLNYTTTEKEMLAVVFSCDKFRSYIIGSKVIVFTDHAAIHYLFAKKDAKPRLIRWILLLQEFDMEIRDKKGSENVVADHLSRLEQLEVGENTCIQEVFLDEQLLEVEAKLPWYADFVNYLACKVIPPDLSYHQKKKFLHDVRSYLWDDPILFKRCSDQVIRRCIPEEEVHDILHHCHSSLYGGHFGATQTAARVLQSGFIGLHSSG